MVDALLLFFWRSGYDRICDRPQRRYFLKDDHLGSIRTTVDQSGNIDGYDDYYPFGLVMPGRSSNSSNPTDANKFTGHERDDEAGLTLDHMGARTYDPVINRFLQIDPATMLQESISPYAYSLNSPINYVDPDGSLPILINGRVMKDTERGDKSYWDRNLIATIKNSGIANPGGTFEYIDGDQIGFSIVPGHNHDGTWPNGNSAGARSLAGKNEARARFNDILAQLERDPKSGLITEKIQIYTHSRGGSFGAGFTAELMSLIKENSDQFADPSNVIDFVLNLAPHQSRAFDSPGGVAGYSINHTEDILSGSSMGGLNAAFSSSTGNGFGSGHNTGSFVREVSAFLKAFNSGGATQSTIDDFINRAKDEYGIEVTVKQ